MIERHITFDVPAGRDQAFERFFVDAYRPAMSRAPGFVGVDLLREIDEPSHYHMTLRFRDADAAAGWRTSPEHQALQPELTMLATTSQIQGYDVIA